MAKEEFRNWNPRTNIKIKYYTDKEKGEYKYFETTTDALFDQVNDVVEEFQASDIKLINRQLYYQLVGKDLIPNYPEIYKRFCQFLTDCRYGGRIDWEAIEDRGRVAAKHIEFDNPSDLLDTSISIYRLPRWKGQGYYLEMYCEKQAGESVLKPVADDHHIHFGYNKGYSSAAAMYKLAMRLKYQLGIGKKVVILYFGDHDPSGLDMIRDIRDRVTEFLSKGDYPLSDEEVENFSIVPVALTMEQIKEFKPPSNYAKIKDPRSKWYIEKYGDVSWELDSINPLKLREIAKDAITLYLDQDKYDAIVEREEKHKRELEDFAEKLSDEVES